MTSHCIFKIVSSFVLFYNKMVRRFIVANYAFDFEAIQAHLDSLSDGQKIKVDKKYSTIVF